MSRSRSTPRPPRVGRPRDPSIEARAIEAALAIYRDHGLPDLSFDRVARQAAIGKAALYSRWDSVEQLLIDGLGMIAPPPVLDDLGSLQCDLRQLTLTLWRLYAGEHGRVTIRIMLDSAVAPEIQPHYQRFVSAYVGAAQEIVARGVRRGELPDDFDPALLLEQVVGTTMLHVLFFPPHRMPLPDADQAFADRLVERVLAGIAA